MNPPTHDPYLNTVQRALREKEYRIKQIKAQQERIKQKHSQSFLHQRFDLHEFFNLPDGVGNILFFIAFILIPYIVGVIFIFITIAGIDFKIFEGINIKEYPIYWAIGYEIIAFLLLLLILKSALEFRHNAQQQQPK